MKLLLKTAPFSQVFFSIQTKLGIIIKNFPIANLIYRIATGLPAIPGRYFATNSNKNYP